MYKTSYIWAACQTFFGWLKLLEKEEKLLEEKNSFGWLECDWM